MAGAPSLNGGGGGAGEAGGTKKHIGWRTKSTLAIGVGAAGVAAASWILFSSRTVTRNVLINGKMNIYHSFKVTKSHE